MAESGYEKWRTDLEESRAGEVAEAERRFMTGVYNWMTAGLLLTAVAAWLIVGTMEDRNSFFWKNPGIFLGLLAGEVVLVLILSFAFKKLSPVMAAVCFIAYSILSGVTLAPIFMIYTRSAIYAAFFTCAGMFGGVSIFGYMTRMRLAGLGSLCFMGLIGLIVAGIVNYFLQSDTFGYIVSFIGVAVFLGLTAWDTQALRELAARNMPQESGRPLSDEMKKYSILGALKLYLDFINLFLYLLRIFGGRRR